MSHTSICRWVARFKAGQQDLNDAAHSGHLPSTTTKSDITKITDLRNQDARYIETDLARFANFFLARVYGAFRKHLKLKNKCKMDITFVNR